MDTPYTFNLLTIAGALSRRRRLIILITLAAALAGLTGAWVRPKWYEARAEFFLKNPFYADRNFVYNSDAKYIDYFANDDDIGRLMILIRSDTVQQQLIGRFHLLEAYKVDSLNAKALFNFRRNFNLRLKLWHTDYRSLVLTYEDRDPVRAAQLSNLAVTLLESSLQQFYTETRANLYQSVLRKVSEEDRTIQLLTDSLVRLREQYGIYDIISPARNNLMLSNMKDNGKPGFARGLEQIQNVESVKDEMVTVRARNWSLAEQYSTGTATHELPLIHLVKAAIPAAYANGLGRLYTAIISAVIGLLFVCLLVLCIDYYRSLTPTPTS